jgi:hypothetical protein
LKDTSVKLNEILKTRKDNVSRFEEETNAVLAEISNVRESGNNTTYTGINVAFLYILYWYHRML